MKKVIKYVLIGLLVIIVMAAFSTCGTSSDTESNTDKTQDTESNTDKIQETERNVSVASLENSTEETGITQETFEESDERFVAGDTIKFKSGLEVYIADVGTYEDRYSAGGGFYVYVELEVTNNGDEVMDFGAPSVKFYADDYALDDVGTLSGIDDFFGYTTIYTGRKARGRCYQLCNDYNSYSVIEAQIGDAVIVVKDDTLFTNPNNETLPVQDSKSIYGIYSVDNGVDAVLSGEVGVYTDDGSDYIRLEALSYGNRYIAEFNGILTQVDENTYQSKDDFGTVITVVFDGFGMQVNVEEVPAGDFYELNGYYEKTGDIIRS